jgi:hypothetical protein
MRPACATRRERLATHPSNKRFQSHLRDPGPTLYGTRMLVGSSRSWNPLRFAVSLLIGVAATFAACANDPKSPASGSAEDGGGAIDASGDVRASDAADAALPLADGAAPRPGFACGPTERCSAGVDVCCFEMRAGGAARCVDPSTTQCQSGRATCSKPSDCRSGERCCGAGPEANVGATNCYARCPASEVELCERDTDCAAGARCVPISGNTSWLSACR